MPTDIITTTTAAPGEDPDLENRLESLGNAFEREEGFGNSVWQRIEQGRALAPTPSFRPTLFSIKGVAVAVIVVGAGLGLWSALPIGTGTESWWLGNRTAWASEIDHAIRQAVVNGVTCRESTVYVMGDGTRHTSSTTSVFCTSPTHYRRDLYDEGVLRETQWYEPVDNGMTQTSVRYDTHTVAVDHHPGPFGDTHPIQRMRNLVKRIERADRLLEPIQIAGRACVGFEFREDSDDDNPSGRFNRIWFDQQTRLPARVEQHGNFTSGEPPQPVIWVQEGFDYAPMLDPSFFKSSVPEGYYAHPTL